jgi:hypothetical protein
MNMDKEQRKIQRQKALKADPDYIRLKELLQRQSPQQIESFHEYYECEEHNVEVNHNGLEI